MYIHLSDIDHLKKMVELHPQAYECDSAWLRRRRSDAYEKWRGFFKPRIKYAKFIDEVTYEKVKTTLENFDSIENNLIGKCACIDYTFGRITKIEKNNVTLTSLLNNEQKSFDIGKEYGLNFDYDTTKTVTYANIDIVDEKETLEYLTQTDFDRQIIDVLIGRTGPYATILKIEHNTMMLNNRCRVYNVSILFTKNSHLGQEGELLTHRMTLSNALHHVL